MSYALIRYNISYYLKTLKFIGPALVFVVFFFINYQIKRIGIWSNCHITAIAVFVLSNWIGVSFVNSEDTTQQYITRLHVRNEVTYHLSKIVSILIFVVPFYILLVFYPIVFGFYTRSLQASEIMVYLIIHFLFSLMGVSIGIFFNSDISKNKNMTMPLHAMIILITVMPLALMFKDNSVVKYAAYLLPPLNYLTERLNTLNDGVFEPDSYFWVFVMYAIVYSIILIAVYNVIIRKRNKQ